MRYRQTALPAFVIAAALAGPAAAQEAEENTIVVTAQRDNATEIVNGGDAGVLRIEGMGYFDPDIVTFYGSDPTGAKTQLVQHVSQLNVLLRALPKQVKAKAPRRIGFRLVQDLEKA